jgi:hypothetical protein
MGTSCEKGTSKDHQEREIYIHKRKLPKNQNGGEIGIRCAGSKCTVKQKVILNLLHALFGPGIFSS